MLALAGCATPAGQGAAAASYENPVIDGDFRDPVVLRRRLVDGVVVRRCGDYYLFFSGDNCCGPNAHYAAMVARSRSASGPLETLGSNGARWHLDLARALWLVEYALGLGSALARQAHSS